MIELYINRVMRTLRCHRDTIRVPPHCTRAGIADLQPRIQSFVGAKRRFLKAGDSHCSLRADARSRTACSEGDWGYRRHVRLVDRPHISRHTRQVAVDSSQQLLTDGCRSTKPFRRRFDIWWGVVETRPKEYCWSAPPHLAVFDLMISLVCFCQKLRKNSTHADSPPGPHSPTSRVH